MSLAARCPGCGTVFRVRAEQLQSHHGQVRCGRCSRVFNAFETLEAGASAPRPAVAPAQPVPPPAEELPQQAAPLPEPAPAASPSELEPAFEMPEEERAETVPAGGDESMAEPEFTAEPPAEIAAAAVEPPPPEPSESEEPIAIPEHGTVGVDLSGVSAPAVVRPGRREHPSPLAHIPEEGVSEGGAATPEPAPEPPAEPPPPAARAKPQPAPARLVFSPVALDEEEERPRRTWAWTLGSVMLLAALAAQLAYLFRADIAAQLPGARPWLEEACAFAGCGVPFPRRIDKVFIESSDLRAEGQGASAMTLVATLRNYAPHVQDYPHLELTLTDTRDEPVARRIFTPADYLKPPASTAGGMAPNRPVDLRLLLDSADLQPAGYRLFLFYP